jgi:hypothetical protein
MARLSLSSLRARLLLLVLLAVLPGFSLMLAAWLVTKRLILQPVDTLVDASRQIAWAISVRERPYRVAEAKSPSWRGPSMT